MTATLEDVDRAPDPQLARCVIAACGMRFEGDIAHGKGVQSVCSPDPYVLEKELTSLLDAKEDGAVLGLISFGTLGALAAHLQVGQWMVARSVIDDAGHVYPTDPGWSVAILRALPDAYYAPLFGSLNALTTAPQKHHAFDTLGAFGVDMESHVVARVAARYGLPYVVARVVLDSVDALVPDAALAGLAADGSTSVAPVLASLARAPFQIPALLDLARKAAVARTALRRGRKLLGHALAYPL